MKLSRYSYIFLSLLISTFFLQSCGGEDIFSIDYSQVPPPFDRSKAVRDTVLPHGVEIYVVKEGNAQFHVTFKDQIVVKFTGRTKGGKIFASSYGRQTDNQTRFKTTFANLHSYTITTRFGPVPPKIEGLRKGLYGMFPGEKRIIVVPPEMAKGGQIQTRVNLEGKTLIYNVELINIAGVPRDEAH